MVQVHLDTDLGGDTDDLCALAMLLKWPEVEITGITVVGDTNGKRTGYVKYVLGLAKRDDIPVAAGADTAHGYYRYELGIPPEEKYWPEPVASLLNPTEEAIDLLKKSIDQGAIVIGIGPFTNLRLLDEKYPGILKSAKLFLMGGYIYPPRSGFPNWKNEDDFNIQVDVNSAKHVLENSNPTLTQLSVTAETSLRKSHLKKLRKSGPLGQLIARQAEAFAIDEKMEERYGKTCEKLPKDIINFQHDALACAVALGWEGVKIEEVPLKFEIKDSYLIETVDKQGRKFRVTVSVDGERFNDFWFETVTIS